MENIDLPFPPQARDLIEATAAANDITPETLIRMAIRELLERSDEGTD